MSDVLQAARDWLAADPDPQTRAELQALVDAGNVEGLRARFDHPLSFGTAGLRGPIGAGPAAMNLVVVGQAAAGFADWLTARGHLGGRVLVGYDARHKSNQFARETARILAGAGYEPWLLDRPTATPVVAFGIRAFDCVAGIVVTASHNPATDNGYKVYLGDGSQIIPPEDQEILECIRAITPAALAERPRSDEITMAGDQVRLAYVRRAAAQVHPGAPRHLVWVHTAMHGVGASAMRAVAHAARFPEPVEVAEQAEPDPHFPTVAFPNPEEPGAIDLAIAKARAVQADVVIANDPDADRCAAAAVVDGSWRMLTGDELGAILGDDAIRRGGHGVLANSVVSSTLLARMARSVGRRHQTTLTGFKWIGRVPELAFGYEEAIGYCCDPAAVPDKDGLTAALAVLRITAQLRRAGRTLADRLDEIMTRHGLHATDQLSVRVDDLDQIGHAMARLRQDTPTALLGQPVTSRDLLEPSADLPATDAVELVGPGVRVVTRPSGTEPKLKCYLEVVLSREETDDPRRAREHAAGLLAQLRREMSDALGIGTS